MNRRYFLKAFERLGIDKGDVLLLHIALSSVGYVDGGPEVLLDALQHRLGASGTLCVVGHSKYGPPWLPEPIDWTPDAPCLYGIVPETFRQMDGVVRSNHPTVSMLARGALAENLIAGHDLAQTPCGLGTPWFRAVCQNALILRIGFHSSTIVNVAMEYFAPDRACTDPMPARLLIGGEWENRCMRFEKPQKSEAEGFPWLDRQRAFENPCRTGEVGNAIGYLHRALDVWDILGRMVT